MLINWNGQAAKWFEEASAYTGYHNHLAQLLAPYLTHTETLCKACGGQGYYQKVEKSSKSK